MHYNIRKRNIRKKIQFNPEKILAGLSFFPEYTNVYMKEQGIVKSRRYQKFVLSVYSFYILTFPES